MRRSGLYRFILAFAVLAALAYGSLSIYLVPVLNLPFGAALAAFLAYATLVLALVGLIAWRFLRRPRPGT
jgi:hypothetical protein